MGKMYTVKPDESINDHVKESISLLNRLTEIVKEAYKYLPGKDCILETGVFLDIDSRAFYSAIEHARNSIEMLDELCDELEEDKDEIRHEYEEKVVQFFNRFMNADLTDETNYRAGELARLVHQLDNRVGALDQELEQERERSNQLEEQERERSNQLEEQITILVRERDLAKKLAKKTIDENHILKNELTRSELELKALREVLDKKYDEIESLTQQLIDTSPNNPCNFCGNCRHYAQVGKDDGDFEGICTQHYIKRVDPDDASCSHFKPTYDTRVVIGKPEFPCCDHCNHDDCDDCTLCPF